MKTTATDNHVAAPAADRDSTVSGLLIKPFIALALAVLGPILGRNRQPGSPPGDPRQRPGNTPATPRQRSGPPPVAKLGRSRSVTAVATANLNLGGHHHG